MPQTEQDAIEPTEEEEEDEDQTWVLDSLVGFLKSPLWSSSLNNFVDKLSVVFEPDDIEDAEGNVERRPEYEQIFKQYRSLVDQLISSHMSELGISEEQFAKACEMAEGTLANKLKSVLFEELWAAENYEVFVRLMARRNVELQLEALDFLAQKYGLVYEVFVPVGANAKHFLSEEHVMREAILRSLDDLELDQTDELEERAELSADMLATRRFSTKPNKEETSKTDKQIEPQTSESSQGDKSEENETANLQRDKARLEEVRHRVDQKMYKALQSALAMDTEEDGAGEDDVKPEEQPEQVSLPEQDGAPKESAEPGEPSPAEESQESKTSREEEIKRRAEYLRQQRDRIINLKQKERTEKISKYLIKEKEKLKNQPRPKTARRGDGAAVDEASRSGQQQQQSEPESKELAYRKTLAARLKAEVVFGGK